MSGRDFDWPDGELLYHGGIPGLEVGDRLFDTSRPGTEPRVVTPIKNQPPRRSTRPPRVWLTPDRELARRCAALWPLKSNYRDPTLGDLYAVVPDGVVRSQKGGREFTAESATIVEVVERACEPIARDSHS